MNGYSNLLNIRDKIESLHETRQYKNNTTLNSFRNSVFDTLKKSKTPKMGVAASKGRSLKGQRVSAKEKENEPEKEKTLYELITQNIQMPEGLLYRGKYCGMRK